MNSYVNGDNEMLYRILDDIKMGWWKMSYKHQAYFVSDFMKDLLGLKTDSISFDEFLKLVREDYYASISKEVENAADLYIYDQTFPIICQSGEIWLHSKIVYKERDPEGNLIFTGFAQVVPSPETSEREKASFLRMNNLLYQLNSISHTLLSFLQAENSDVVINKILKDILKLFKGGRTYIIEYDWENMTQSCTYEAVDSDVNEEQERLTGLPMSESPWWTKQVTSGASIILSTLDELPEEAASEKELLELQDIKSLIVLPLISRDKVWGYVGIDIVEEQHTWSNEDCQWFSSLTNIISICVELQRSEHEAQLDRSYLQNLYRHMPLGYMRLKVLYDKNNVPADYLFVDANYAAGEISGYPISTYIGHTGSELKHRLNRYLPHLVNTLTSDSYVEANHYLKDVERHCHSIMYSTQKDEVICLFSDTTESHNTHEALDRSEKILRNIYDNLPAGIELYDKEGVLIDMNIKDVEIFGLQRKEDALGVSIFNNPNIPNDIKEKIRKQESVSFRLDYSFDSIESYYSSLKRDSFELYTTASMLYDKQGNLTNYLLINIDNTEINNAYSRIAEFETSFSVISQFGKIGYCKFDILTKEGAGVPQWYRNLGEEASTPLNQIIGVYTHVHDEDRAFIVECIRRVKLEEIDNFSKDLRVHMKDGWKWTRINVMRNPMNTDPTKLEMICVNYDITELKETELKLIEAKDKAEVSDRLKSAFLANMSHEIRTPLNAIVGFSNLLVEAEDKEERSTYLNIVQENNELLLQLISDILDLSKIEAGTLDIVKDNVDVNSLCNEIIRSSSIKANENNIKIQFDQYMPVCHIYSDKNRLTQIITNFINNALKFTTEGTISLGYYLQSENEIRFYVRDTGCGIPEQEAKTVFERFVKLNNFVQGTGLGLSICKSLVEQMGGYIGVDSKVGEGSCFWFVHPYSSDYELKSTGGASENRSSYQSGINKDRQPTILIAEDTDSNFLLVSTILKKTFTLVRARNGVEAVELFSKVRPDVILMDIKMPEMTGIDATKEIRKVDKTVPIIAVTAFAFDSDRQRALDAGCNDYMAKPIKSQELLTKLENMICNQN